MAEPLAPTVTAVYVRNEKEGEEAIVVYCDGRYATLSVVKPPERRVGGEDGAEKPPFVARPR
jgi:hypothetical protein